MRRVSRLVLVAGVLSAAVGSAGGQQPETLEQIFNHSAAALEAGEFQQAQAGFDQVLATDPSNVPALANLGVLYSRTHRFARAVDMDKRALAVEPKNGDVLMNLGLALMKQADYVHAEPYFVRLQQTNGTNTRATLLLATCLILGASPQRGLDLLQSRHLEQADSSMLTLEAVAYVRLNRREEAHALFTQLLGNGSTRAQANFLLGESLHDGHQLQDAADAFRETLQQDPTYAGAHRELGKVLISMQRFTEAESELGLALQQDGDDAEAAYFLGALFVQTTRGLQGIPYLELAQKAMPDSWAVPFYLGKAMLSQKQPAKAVPLLKEAAAMDADEPQVFYLLANALRSTGQVAAAKQAMARVQELHSTALEAEKRSMAQRVEVVR